MAVNIEKLKSMTPPQGMDFHIAKLGHIVLQVSDLEKSTAFYTHVLGLKVSDNGHFLVAEDGSPFYYMADTAWELFHRLNREEAEARDHRKLANELDLLSFPDLLGGGLGISPRHDPNRSDCRRHGRSRCGDGVGAGWSSRGPIP